MNLSATKIVSIPYGTIKRQQPDFPLFHLANVSIPYGTIKRAIYAQRIDWFLRFQFLMVRLKDRQHTAVEILSDVSIPYGTIKSSATAAMPRRTILFQFLMVRLKGEKNV